MLVAATTSLLGHIVTFLISTCLMQKRCSSSIPANFYVSIGVCYSKIRIPSIVVQQPCAYTRIIVESRIHAKVLSGCLCDILEI